MNRKTIMALAFIISATIGFISCVNKTPTSKEPLNTEELTKNQPEVHGTLIKAEDVQLTDPLNQQWINEGKSIYELKCQACHKLTSERIVGPGWQGLTKKRKPEWILNMITNVDIMLEQDPEAQKLLEECLVRMPNQNLTKEEARKVLEFQRSNDAGK